MSKTLLLFMFSRNVDTYINVIAHCYDKLHVEKIVFVHVRNTKTGLSTEEEANTVFNRVWAQLESLSKGIYIDYRQSEPTHHANSDSGIDIYKRIHGQSITKVQEHVDYTKLKKETENIVKNYGGANNCILDLTPSSKVPALDLFAVSLALNIKSVYVFELKDFINEESPWESLYHSLGNNKYSYTDLYSTLAITSSQKDLVRKKYVTWYVIAAFVTTSVLSLLILFIAGTQYYFLSFIGLVSSIIGTVTAIAASIKDK